MPIDKPFTAESFQSVAEYLPLIMWRISADFRHGWMNRACQNYIGDALEDHVGIAWLGHLHPEDGERVRDHLDQAFSAREATSVEFRLRRRDGVYRWFMDVAAPVFDDGIFTGFVGCCTDVTARKVAEERLENGRIAAATVLTVLTTPAVHD